MLLNEFVFNYEVYSKEMKIFYIANARIPTEKAHGIQIIKMCEVFAGVEGITVELIIPRRFNYVKKNPFEYYGVEKNFKIKKLFCFDLIAIDKFIGHLGLWIESLTFFIPALLCIFFKKADVIFIRDKMLLPFVLFKKNVIFEAHTFPKKYFLYSLFLKRVKKIIVITEKLKELFVQQGISENKILVAPDGVDIKDFDIECSQLEARRKLDLPQDKKIILYTGHLYEWKGADVLFKVAQNFQNNVLLVFVGGTKEDIVKFRQKAKDIKNVVIKGHKSHKEIPYWLKAADVLVLPNSGKQEISKHWTSPLKLFEYMASKRPIIASDLPSIREILNKDNSVLFEADNSEKLAEGIKKALQDAELADKISKQAFSDVQNYTWQKRAGKILKFV